MHAILQNVDDVMNIRFFQVTIKVLVALPKRSMCLIRSVLLLIFLLGPQASASFEELEAGARTLGFAGAVVALPQGSEGMMSNPATLIIKPHVFDFFSSYSKPFTVKALHNGTVAGRYSFKHFCLAGAISYFGNELYRESQYRLAAAVSLFEHVNGGVCIRYADLAIARYGQAGTLVCDAGSIVRLSDRLNWGFVIKNINYAHIGASQEPLPQIYSTGISLRPIDSVLFNLDVYKDVRFSLDVRAGVEYFPLHYLGLRTGVGTEPTRFCFGCSVIINHFKLGYAACQHAELGLTHMMAISIF